MSDATFTCPDLSTFCGLDELGLEAVGQRLESDRAVLACRVTELDEWCRRCGCEGSPRDTLTRRLAHEPFGWRPTTLLVTLRRSRRRGPGSVLEHGELRGPGRGQPIFEADFQSCSYGFRPNRRAHDAIAEIHLLDSTR